MKVFSAILLTTLTISLTGCLGDILGVHPNYDYLKNQSGDNVLDCGGDSIITNNGFHKRFWDANNLPHGTTEFTCKNGKAYLPEDCQGNPLNRKQLKAYWNKYDIPVGVTGFNCVNGKPIW